MAQFGGSVRQCPNLCIFIIRIIIRLINNKIFSCNFRELCPFTGRIEIALILIIQVLRLTGLDGEKNFVDGESFLRVLAPSRETNLLKVKKEKNGNKH